MNPLPSAVLSKQFKSAKEALASGIIFDTFYRKFVIDIEGETFIFNWFSARKAKKSLNIISEITTIVSKLEIEYEKALESKDTKAMCEVVLEYHIALSRHKENIITGLGYIIGRRKFNRAMGEWHWNFITRGLIIPELKSVGVPPKG